MPAAMLGTLKPHVYRFRLGGFEVTTISDGSVIRQPITPPLALDQTPEAVAALAAANHLPDDRFENGYAVTLVNTGREIVMFDAGNGSARRGGGAGLLRTRLADAGYKPDDVDVIAFTHAHPDHIGGVREAGAPAFPNARYVMGQREHDCWTSGEGIPDRRADSRTMFLDLIPPLADKLDLIAPDTEIVPGIRALEAHGHSPGHLIYRVESEGQAVLVWGDITNHFVFSLQRPDWRVSFDDIPEQATATRNRVLAAVATEGIAAIGFHMPFPAVGYVRNDGGAFRWMPVTYQFAV